MATTPKVTAATAKKVARLAELNAQAFGIKKEIDALRAEVLADMQKMFPKTLPEDVKRNIVVNGVKVTLIEPKPVLVIDEGMLKNALGEKKWLTVSTRILDRKKLVAAIAAKDIEADIVAECSEEQAGAADHIKLA